MGKKSRYGSHLPVLELLFKYSNIKDVFEYGCGVYSTRFFVDNAQTVTSVEMAEKTWYDKVKAEIVSDKLNLLCLLGKSEAIEYFSGVGKTYDLVFIDGWSRLACAKAAFGKTETIAIHDLRARWFRRRRSGWKRLVSDNYKIIVMKIANPPTLIYTSNENLFKELKKHNGMVIRG